MATTHTAGRIGWRPVCACLSGASTISGFRRVGGSAGVHHLAYISADSRLDGRTTLLQRATGDGVHGDFAGITTAMADRDG